MMLAHQKTRSAQPRAPCVLLLLLAANCAVALQLTASLSVTGRGELKAAVALASVPTLQLAFSADTPLHVGGDTRRQTADTIKLLHRETSNGSDGIGSFVETALTWGIAQGPGAAANVTTSLKTYEGGEFIVAGAKVGCVPLTGTASAAAEKPVVGFPSVNLSQASALGFAYWQGLWPSPFTSRNLSTASIGASRPKRHDGPLVFSLPAAATAGDPGKQPAPRASIVIAPLSDTVGTVFNSAIDAQAAGDPSLYFGPSAAAAALEAGYGYQVAFVGGAGVTDAMRRYGDLLRRYVGVTGERLADPFVDKVSLWTDNGAALFWNAAGKAVLPPPTVALPAALEALHKAELPVGALQLDGWWMNQTTLQPDSQLFPGGWSAFQESVGGNATSLLLYKAFFSPDYDLFRRFGKVQSPTGAWYPAPDDAAGFFAALFRQGLALGMTSFETDFMSDHMLPTPGLSNTTGGLLAYLHGMAGAGASLNVPMQWCMPTAGIVLAAAGLPAVTNARASVDYACEGPLDMKVTWRNNYQIGNAGLLFWAAGVAPSKDIFWTTADQPGAPSCCGSAHRNPNFELDATLAVLSTGPVGIGDAVGATNASLVRRLAMSDMTVLKPSKPITAVDSTFVPGPGSADSHGSSETPFVGFLPLTADGDCSAKRPCSPALHQTHSNVTLQDGYAAGLSGTSVAWHLLMAIHLGEFRPPVMDVYPKMGLVRYYLRETRWQACANGSAVTGACALPVDLASGPLLPDMSSGPTRLDSKGAVAWRLFSLSPVLPLPGGDPSSSSAPGWALLGELGKIVPVSPLRFSAVGVRQAAPGPFASCLAFRLNIAAGEEVTVSAVSPGGVFREQVFTAASCDNSRCSLCE